MENKKHHITAVIYNKKGHVISIGENSMVKTHPLQAELASNCGKPDAIYLHAEIHAITRCKELDQAHRIEVYRYNKMGQPVLAKPCVICQSAIAQTNIKEVFHT